MSEADAALREKRQCCFASLQERKAPWRDADAGGFGQEAIRRLWERRAVNGNATPLPAMKLLATHQLALALAQARLGQRPRLGEVWHVAAFMSKSQLLREHYPYVSETLESALSAIGDFNFLCAALAGRDEIELIKWWSATGAPVSEALNFDPAVGDRIAVDLLELDDEAEASIKVRELVARAPGPNVDVF
jgi:hypothetical protein